MKKFEITDETIYVKGVTLRRIRSNISFLNIKPGELGGFVEKESNLSQHGFAWVCDNAQVFGDARVCDSAQVCGDAQVFGDAWVCDNAQVCGDAQVFGDAQVCGDAQVFGDARVCDSAQVCGDVQVFNKARVCGDTRVCDSAQVFGNAQVFGDARVCDSAQVCGDARVCDSAQVCGDARVCDNALVFGDARVCDSAQVCGDAQVFGDARVCDSAQVCGDAQVFNKARVCGDTNTKTKKSNMLETVEFYVSQVRAGKTHDQVISRIRVLGIEDSKIKTLNISATGLNYVILPETKIINGVECDMHVTIADECQFTFAESVTHPHYYTRVNPIDRLVSLGVVYDTKEKAAKACKARYGIKDDE